MYEPGRLTLAAEGSGVLTVYFLRMCTAGRLAQASTHNADPTQDVRTRLPSSRHMTVGTLTSFGISFCT